MADKVNFPAKIKTPNGTLYNNMNFANICNNNLKKLQTYNDKLVGTNLQKYVSYKTGAQEKSIPNSHTYGKGYVMINVAYAVFQAYSKRIHKRVDDRGTKPFERMKSDKKMTILKQVCDYSRRING